MTEEKTTNKKNCGSKGKVMFAYGFIQLSTSITSAIALAVIALGVFSIKKEAKVFNTCVAEVQASGKSSSFAVRYCNGG